MASVELRRLFALHQIDAEILDIRRRAARLDVGFEEAAKLKELEAKDASEGAAARALITEQVDTELQQRGFDDKMKKFEKQLFGGTMVNPREVEAMQKEIAILKRNRDALDDRLLELMDLVPAAQKVADSLATQINAAKAAIAAKRQVAVGEKAKLEADYKAAVAKREEAKKAVPPGLFARYDSIAKRHEGVGMAEVVKKKACGACGTLLPARSIQLALEGTVMTCESCHRILYYTDGAI
jgi:predicted  nucleic acid-binding Zn-ribbon protein